MIFKFSAPSGYSPLVSIFRADTLALLGSATATESVAPRFYTVDVNIGSYTGKVKASLESPAGAFYGSTVDGELSDNPYGHNILAIESQTSLLGTGAVSISAPVSLSGYITDPLIINDDYLTANGRSLKWTVDKPAGVTVGAATCQLGFSHPSKGSFQVEGMITDALDGKIELSFDIHRQDSQHLKPGEFRWSAQVTSDDGSELTQIHEKEDRKAVWIAKSTD